eukprot:2365876-Prymnesium_polylepis.1
MHNWKSRASSRKGSVEDLRVVLLQSLPPLAIQAARGNAAAVLRVLEGHKYDSEVVGCRFGAVVTGWHMRGSCEQALRSRHQFRIRLRCWHCL